MVFLDFIDLVTGSRALIERALVQDDDFARIDNEYGQQEEGYSNTAMYSQFSSSSSSSSSSQFGGSGTTAMTSSTPLLSKTAEAELYLLATNFLLYVAMVIITTIVAKIYFPSSLERGNDNIPYTSTTLGGGAKSNATTARRGRPSETTRSSYSYRRRTDKNSEIIDDKDRTLDDLLVAGATDDDDDDDDEEEALYSDDDDNDSFDDHDDDEEEDDLLLEGSAGRPGVFEFDQDPATSRAKIVQRLLFCSLMLNLTFVTWGALQERMLTRRYPRHTGDYFTYSYALVFTNRFWTLIMSGCMWLYLKPRRSQSTVLYEYSFPAISNMLSSWCQYEALRYVSFPATTIFKSFKLAPVMLMGKLLGNKTYPAYDYFVAVVIGIGIAMFMSSTDELSFATDAYGNDETANEKWTGVMLLGLFLFFDSFTSQFQSRMFQRHAQMSMVELMFATSAFSTVLSWITLVHTHELSAALEFVYEHSEIHLHFFMFSICSTIGQLFIYYTIKNFGAVVFTIIMTTRILLSIALSVVLYGHTVTGVGFLGLCLVMIAVLYRIKRKAEGTQLIKWQGIIDEKGPELVQEWHEHVDM